MESPPGIAALFVIRFDIRTGAVIVEVEGVVEYKSLPSGLHNVNEDLVYFVHEQYAGVSAFVNQPAAEAERNAKMFAVGVLVPLSTGRLGKSWRHAPRLRELTLFVVPGLYSSHLATDTKATRQETCRGYALSEYWNTFKTGSPAAADPESPLESPISLRFRPGDRPDGHRNRAFSDAIVLQTPRPTLTPFHPASSLPDFLECFGPLIFPLYRAALLRKRILFMVEAPALPEDHTPPLRPRPLFNVGIHDIPDLASYDSDRSTQNLEKDPSWIACSTDTVLSMKPELYDALVTLPPPYSQQGSERAFPKIALMDHSSTKHNANKTVQLKATQRDARRYAMLRKGLRQFSSDGAASPNTEDSDADSTYSSSSIVEPLSWTRLAYTSFMWWASAGENRDGLSKEEEEHQIEQDARLLASLESLAYPASNSNGRRSLHLEDQSQEPPEVALVAYFRRLTTQIFYTLAGAVARHDSDGHSDVYEPYSDAPVNDEGDLSLSMSRSLHVEDDDNAPCYARDSRETTLVDCEAEEPITITIADMAEMGLDVWSATDRIFVEELVLLWWGRSAHVDSARIRCCGISIL
ncbi:uncharacterized protein N7443_001569 [Penicillium atrosanguineum]|uniref:uncharacterized protein n=1 Tax=Penicillium atrosanguineum TaxID=1132637 RepID=UPI0023A56224|nr:uncharacterized protein N7443_001569 [Penicillium atrosanguineum]KAJ5314685.1 hypothetical protein N7443_001569 [Penicillium atrosanguineum]